MPYEIDVNLIQREVFAKFADGRTFRTDKVGVTGSNYTMKRMACLRLVEQAPKGDRHGSLWKIKHNPMDPEHLDTALQEFSRGVIYDRPGACVDCTFSQSATSGCVQLELFRQTRDQLHGESPTPQKPIE